MQSINVSQLDKDFKYEVAARPGAEFFKRCFSCGTCTASCPVSEIDENFNPRLFIHQALLGMRKELLSSPLLWYCTQCYTCYARCPQDVRFTDVMAVLRDMAIEQGFAPKNMKDKAEKIELVAQELRHALTEYAWLGEKGKDCAACLKEIKSRLNKGLKELESK